MSGATGGVTGAGGRAAPTSRAVVAANAILARALRGDDRPSPPSPAPLPKRRPASRGARARHIAAAGGLAVLALLAFLYPAPRADAPRDAETSLAWMAPR